jgi:exosortase
MKAVPLPCFQRWHLAALLVGTAWVLAVRQMSLEWTVNPQYQYGWLVPLLTLFLYARAWPHRPTPAPATAGWPWLLLVVVLAVVATPLRVIEEANPDWRPLDDWFAAQAAILTAWVIYLMGGRPWLRYFIFPLLFPLVAVPWPSGLETDIVQGLQRAVAAIGVEASSWMGWAAYQRGNLIVLPHGIVGINEACSGIRSLQSSLMIALFLGAYFVLTRARRGLLVVLGLAVAFALNIVRAMFLIIVMNTQGASSTLKFHDPAGLTIAFATLLVLWFVAGFLAPRSTPEPGPAASGPLPAAWRALPARSFAVLLAVWLAAEVFDQAWYGWHERQSVPGPLWTLQWPVVRPDFRDRSIDEATQNTLRYDQGLHGEWNDGNYWDIYFFSWKPGRGAAGLANFHHPDICLPAAGFILRANYGVENITTRGLTLPVSRYLFQDPFSGALYYVFQAVTDDRLRPDVQNQEIETDRAQRLQAAWEGHRNAGQRSLMLVNRGAPNLDAAENGLRALLNDSLRVERTGDAPVTAGP